jgi:hypothetical protein
LPPTGAGAPPAEPAEPPTEIAEPEARAAPPPAPSERRTIQIGERPGPLRPAPAANPGARPPRTLGTPRLLAVVALILFVVVAAVLLLLAF